jgi:predicted PurR-regulated permease PerM
MLINILIVFFIILIVYQVFLYNIVGSNIMEGMESSYQPYDTNNPNNAMILAQQNAGNIQVLKQQLDKIVNLDKQVQDISGNLITLTNQVNSMVGKQQTMVESKMPSSTPQISGLK